ncbi:MAG: histidine kinase [Aureispira sp.]|nr:histidine kinase [Aureispira sp.]
MQLKRYFWRVNIIGWALIFVTNLFVRKLAMPSFVWSVEIIDTAMLSVVGLVLTGLIRMFFNKTALIAKRPLILILSGIGLMISVAVAHTLIVLVLVSVVHGEFWELSTRAFLPLFIGNFVSLMFIHGIWILGYIGTRYFAKIQQAELDKIRLANALNEAKLNTLKGQINPHYMFNCLNNIRALMLEDVDKAREMITRLSETLRYSLNSTKTKKVRLVQELEIVQHFIQLSTIQLEDRLVYKQEVESGLEDALLPPMLLQILIENAIKHGISKLPRGGTLLLNIQQKKDKLHIIVQNDYSMEPSSSYAESSTQIGLKNIKQRLELLYHGQASFELKVEADQVIAKVVLPC